jgi:hypothetical protein
MLTSAARAADPRLEWLKEQVRRVCATDAPEK